MRTSLKQLVGILAFSVLSLSAFATEPCKSLDLRLAISVPGAGFFSAAPGAPVLVTTEHSTGLEVICETGAYPPPKPGFPYAFSWNGGPTTSSEFTFVNAPAAGQQVTHQVSVIQTVNGIPQPPFTLSVTLKGAAAGAPRCSIVPLNNPVVRVGTPLQVTANCSPAATQFQWIARSNTASVKITAGANSSSATLYADQASLGSHFPVYLVASNAAGSAHATGRLVHVDPHVGEHPASLVPHFYQSILRRAPDAGGRAYWESEATRMMARGASINEGWYAMAGSFFGSAEYRGFNRGNSGYIEDLYRTFFNRAPDAAGLIYWTGQLNQGLPREAALASFMFLDEFKILTEQKFGRVEVRPEVVTVVDFYRGLLGRLPEDAGFAYWLDRFIEAQCWKNRDVVQVEADEISKLFLSSPEYIGKQRSNGQFLGDLYNAFMRRGGDLAGSQYWINELASGRRSRESVREEFLQSPEFKARLDAVTAASCDQHINIRTPLDGLSMEPVPSDSGMLPLQQMLFRWYPDPPIKVDSAKFHLGGGRIVDASLYARQALFGADYVMREAFAPLNPLSRFGALPSGPIQMRFYGSGLDGGSSMVYHMHLGAVPPGMILDPTPGASSLRLVSRMKAINQASKKNYQSLQAATGAQMDWTPRVNALTYMDGRWNKLESIINELRAGRSVVFFIRPDGTKVEVQPSALPEIDRAAEHMLNTLALGSVTSLVKLSPNATKDLLMLRKMNEMTKGATSAATLTLLGVGVGVPVLLPEAAAAAGAVSLGGRAMVVASMAVAFGIGAYDFATNSHAITSKEAWTEFKPVAEYIGEEFVGILQDQALKYLETPQIKWGAAISDAHMSNLGEMISLASDADSAYSLLSPLTEIAGAYVRGLVNPDPVCSPPCAAGEICVRQCEVANISCANICVVPDKPVSAISAATTSGSLAFLKYLQ
jgi:hypothetical protein